MNSWWTRWPSWVGGVAGAATALYGIAVLIGALAGHREFVGLAHGAWPAGALLLGATAVAVPAGRRPPRAVSLSAWAVAALALTGSCWLLLSLVELILTGTVRDREGNSDWLAFAERSGLVVVGALFVATALAWPRRGAGVCVHCGGTHPPVPTRWHPRPAAAPPVVRRIAYAGCASFLPYLALHTLGAAGVAGIEPDGFRPPWPAIGVGILGIGLAVFLLLGLVRPWGMEFPRWTLWLAGRRVPRFLPLVPVWLVAPTLALYGTGSLAYAFFTDYGVLGLGGAASIAFGTYGSALAVAAVSYQIRTRPSCLPSVSRGPRSYSLTT